MLQRRVFANDHAINFNDYNRSLRGQRIYKDISHRGPNYQNRQLRLINNQVTQFIDYETFLTFAKTYENYRNTMMTSSSSSSSTSLPSPITILQGNQSYIIYQNILNHKRQCTFCSTCTTFDQMCQCLEARNILYPYGSVQDGNTTNTSFSFPFPLHLQSLAEIELALQQAIPRVSETLLPSTTSSMNSTIPVLVSTHTHNHPHHHAQTQTVSFVTQPTTTTTTTTGLGTTTQVLNDYTRIVPIRHPSSTMNTNEFTSLRPKIITSYPYEGSIDFERPRNLLPSLQDTPTFRSDVIVEPRQYLKYFPQEFQRQTTVVNNVIKVKEPCTQQQPTQPQPQPCCNPSPCYPAYLPRPCLPKNSCCQ